MVGDVCLDFGTRSLELGIGMEVSAVWLVRGGLVSDAVPPAGCPGNCLDDFPAASSPPRIYALPGIVRVFISLAVSAHTRPILPPRNARPPSYCTCIHQHHHHDDDPYCISRSHYSALPYLCPVPYRTPPHSRATLYCSCILRRPAHPFALLDVRFVITDHTRSFALSARCLFVSVSVLSPRPRTSPLYPSLYLSFHLHLRIYSHIHRSQ